MHMRDIIENLYGGSPHLDLYMGVIEATEGIVRYMREQAIQAIGQAMMGAKGYRPGRDDAVIARQLSSVPLARASLCPSVATICSFFPSASHRTPEIA